MRLFLLSSAMCYQIRIAAICVPDLTCTVYQSLSPQSKNYALIVVTSYPSHASATSPSSLETFSSSPKMYPSLL